MLFISQFLNTVIFAPSISEFYYTPMREVLVGTIGAIAVFLISYKGYPVDEDRAKGHWTERWLTDRRVSYWAAFGALGVAFFPTFTNIDITLEPEPLVYAFISSDITGFFHQGSAVLFFVALGVFCVRNFRRGTENSEADKKENAFYWRCGMALFGCVIVLIIIGWTLKNNPDSNMASLIDRLKLIFWVEAIGLGIFAVAWLRKGQAKTTAPAAFRQFFGL